MKSQTSRLLAVALLAGGLAGCGGVADGSLIDMDFWDASPLFLDNDQAELGLAEMAKGNYGMAERHYTRALKKNAKDVDALLGLGVLYQNTGQLTKAREMYEAILAIRPERSVKMSVWANLSPKPVIDIASVNLALLESGGVPGGMTKAAVGAAAGGDPNARRLGPDRAHGAGGGRRRGAAARWLDGLVRVDGRRR